MRKIILILFFVTFNSIFPQEFITLFSNELTDRIKYEAHTKQAVNKELELAVKIHPELLYYYITFYNARYGAEVLPAFQIQHGDLGLQRSSYIKKQLEWFQREGMIIQTRDTNPMTQAGQREYFSKYNSFKDFEISTTCDTCIRLDTNKQNYYIYKYYSNNPQITFNSNEDYNALRSEFEKKYYRDDLESYKKLKNRDLTGDEAQTIFSEIIRHWYLYSGDSENEAFAADFSILLFKHCNELRDSKFEHLKILASYSSFNLNSYTYRLDYPNNNFYKEYSFDISGSRLYFGLDYSIYLTKKNAPLSKITLEAGYSFGEINKTYIFTYLSELPAFNGAQEQHIIAKMNPDKNNIKIGKMNSFSFKAAMPILFIGDNLNIGAGGLISYTSIDLVSKVDFYYQLIERGIRIGGGIWTTVKASGYIKSSEKEEKYTYTQLNPLLFINYQLPFHFNLKAELSVNYYLLGFSYGIF